MPRFNRPVTGYATRLGYLYCIACHPHQAPGDEPVYGDFASDSDDEPCETCGKPTRPTYAEQDVLHSVWFCNRRHVAEIALSHPDLTRAELETRLARLCELGLAVREGAHYQRTTPALAPVEV